MATVRVARWAAWLAVLTIPWVARAEIRSWRIKGITSKVEAEFVKLGDDQMVYVKLASGADGKFAFDRLSPDDQGYVRLHAGLAKPSAQPAAATGRLGKLKADAERCSTAEEALRVYRVFADDPTTTDADRQAIAADMKELAGLAERHMVRHRGKWVSEEEYKKVRDQATQLMRQGLELLRLKNEDAFKKKFAEAAALEPDSLRAEFTLALLYGLVAKDNDAADKYYEACLKRDPDNIVVLNNLAVTSVKRGDPRDAAMRWRKVVELQPDQRTVQNLGRFIELAGKKDIDVPQPVIDSVSEMYATLIAGDKFDGADLNHGWLYFLLDDEMLSLDDDKDKSKQASAVPPVADDGSTVIGGGTGFVVAPGYILTNFHVVDGGTTFDLQTSDGGPGQLLRAKLVATSKSPDLALLHCEQLQAPPLPIADELCGRGTDIMALGYPEMFALGASLKATRGVISAVPSPAVENMYLYDATINPGNSGGPVCDSRGRVVAVTTVVTRTVGRYGGGIPSPVALGFVRQHIANYTAPESPAQVLEWPAVDARVSPSTVLVWSRSQGGKSRPQEVAASAIEDKDCMKCGGIGVLKCMTPGCVKGTVPVKRDGSTRRTICRNCDGKWLIKCTECDGTGNDPRLAKPKSNTDSPPSDSSSRLGEMAPRAPVPAPEANIVVRPGPQPVVFLPGQIEPRLPIYYGLHPATAAHIANARRTGAMAVATAYASGDPSFTWSSTEGALLVGADLGIGSFNGSPTVVAVRDIRLTEKGLELGTWHGSAPDSVARVLAPPGYAVGRINVRKGAHLDAVTIIFMRVDQLRLDPNDQLQSVPIGGMGGGPRSLAPPAGALVTSFSGSLDRAIDGRLSGIGLDFVRAATDP